jgi:hypothetical protein
MGWCVVENAPELEITLESTPPELLQARRHTSEVRDEARGRLRELYFQYADDWQRWLEHHADIQRWALELRASNAASDGVWDFSWEIEMAWREFASELPAFDASLPAAVQSELADCRTILDAIADAASRWSADEAVSPSRPSLDAALPLAAWPDTRALVQISGPRDWGAIVNVGSRQLVSTAFTAALRDAGLVDGWTTTKAPLYDIDFEPRTSHELLLVTTTVAVRQASVRITDMTVLERDARGALARPAYIDKPGPDGFPLVLPWLLASPGAARCLIAADLAGVELHELSTSPDDG